MLVLRQRLRPGNGEAVDAPLRGVVQVHVGPAAGGTRPLPREGAVGRVLVGAKGGRAAGADVVAGDVHDVAAPARDHVRDHRPARTGRPPSGSCSRRSRSRRASCRGRRWPCLPARCRRCSRARPRRRSAQRGRRPRAARPPPHPRPRRTPAPPAAGLLEGGHEVVNLLADIADRHVRAFTRPGLGPKAFPSPSAAPVTIADRPGKRPGMIPPLARRYDACMIASPQPAWRGFPSLAPLLGAVTRLFEPRLLVRRSLPVAASPEAVWEALIDLPPLARARPLHPLGAPHR